VLISIIAWTIVTDENAVSFTAIKVDVTGLGLIKSFGFEI